MNPRVEISVVGIEGLRHFEWPEGWPVPPVDSCVAGVGDEDLWVRTVVYYPQGEDEGEAPFVYVVLGKRSRS